MTIKKEFTDEEMLSDERPPPPQIVFKEMDEAELGRERKLESAENSTRWFEKNKVTRVPVVALEEDTIKIRDQNWVCFSWIKPEEYGALHHQKGTYNGSLIKFRGCFKTVEEAHEHVQRIMRIDRHFDVHVVPTHAWSAMEDDDSMVENREYADETIAEVIKGYFKRENERAASLRDRIRSNERAAATGQFRDEKTTDFFRSANPELAEPMIKEISAEDEERVFGDRGSVWQESKAIHRDPNAKPISLAELAERAGVQPQGRPFMNVALSELATSKPSVSRIVSEVILEDDGEDGA